MNTTDNKPAEIVIAVSEERERIGDVGTVKKTRVTATEEGKGKTVAYSLICDRKQLSRQSLETLFLWLLLVVVVDTMLALCE